MLHGLKEPAAVVFDLFETGLGVSRSLGQKGIKVIGIDYKKDIGWYSRYVKPYKCPHPVDEENKFLNWLHSRFTGIEKKLPVFFTSDNFLKIFSKYRSFLSEYFLFNLSEHDLLEKIYDKYTQYLLALNNGIPVPCTWKINDFQDIDKLPHNINFPAFIKGQEVNSWRKNFGGTLKGIKVNDRKELLKEVEEIISKKVPIIVQEIITGPDTNHFKYCSYTDARGNILAEFTLRKIRQWPVHFGVGAVVESVYKPELIDVGRKLFTSIGYKGIGSAEFKIDERDGKLKLIEINPRYWQQNYLATACGINFPYINYFDLVEGNYGCARSFKEGIKWINIYMDFNALAAYKKEGVITFYEWIKSLKGKKIYHDFIWTDPLPLFYEIRFGKKLYKIPGYLWKKLFRK